MPTPPAETQPAPRVTLSRELSGFLIELAIALQSHGVYPPRHPFLARSAEAVMRRLDALLLERDSLSFGVARRQLVIEGVATDPANAVLSGLAGRLHRHRVGAVTVSRGVEPGELAAFLSALAAEAEVSGPLLALEDAAPGWPHVRLHPLSYAGLELTGDAGPDAAAAETRAPELWIGLARAALAGEADGAPEPAAVARAIDEHPRAAAYDQVIVGYLLQLAEELRGEGGRGSSEVRRRLARMIESLSPETLRRLVEMGGDAAQRRRFLLDASHAFAGEAVVRLVEAAAVARGQTISHSLLRLLSKLAAHADASAASSGSADSELREQVRFLVAGWELQDPNPEGYTAALDRLAHFSVGVTGLIPGPNDPEPARIVQTALEVDATGEAVWAAAARMASGDDLPALVDLLNAAPEGARLAEALRDYVASGDAVRRLLRAGPTAAPALDRVLARLGEAAVPALLDEMTESDARVVRRAALTRLAALPAETVAREAARRLSDPRWYVLRNLLSLLGELNARPDGFSPAPYLRHEDARVRREAFRIALRTAEERSRAIPLALVDGDAQVLRAGLAECAAECPAAAVPLVCRRIDDPGADAELRLLAIRVLGGSREPLALRTLVRLADGGRTLLGKRRLAATSPELLAALSALAAGWREYPDAAPLLTAAMKSTDHDVLRAVLAGKDGR